MNSSSMRSKAALSLLIFMLATLSSSFAVASPKQETCVTKTLQLSLAKKFFEGTKNSIKAGEYENEGFERWPLDGEAAQVHPIFGYNSYFHNALNANTIEQLAVSAHTKGKSFHVADLFGSAVFSEHPEYFSSLTGIRLAPLEHRALPHGYPAQNWNEVCGDIYTSKLWLKLDQNMKSRGISAFDLIVIRPEGPLSFQLVIADRIDKGQSRQTFFQINGTILRRAWRRLNRDGGQILLQLNSEVAKSSYFSRWVTLLSESGLQTNLITKSHVSGKIENPVLRLVSTNKSPKELPLLP